MIVEKDPGHSRGAFLAAIAVLANIYLCGFGIDGLLSLVDEILRATSGHSPLGAVRGIVASLVSFATPLAILAVIFVPHLPKRVFVPLILFEIWCAFYAPPFWWQ